MELKYVFSANKVYTKQHAITPDVEKISINLKTKMRTSTDTRSQK